MSLTDRSISATDSVSLDHELEALQSAVAQSRRNRWHGGDVIEPEFQGYLAALIGPPTPLTYGAELEPSPVWRQHRNTWRETILEVDNEVSFIIGTPAHLPTSPTSPTSPMSLD